MIIGNDRYHDGQRYRTRWLKLFSEFDLLKINNMHKNRYKIVSRLFPASCQEESEHPPLLSEAEIQKDQRQIFTNSFHFSLKREIERLPYIHQICAVSHQLWRKHGKNLPVTMLAIACRASLTAVI